jgi:hypothetical protein
MANASYTAFKNGILTGAYDLDTAVLKVALVGGYTFSAAHTSMADVTSAGGVVNGTPATLANVTIVAGVFDADDNTITTTASGSSHVLIVYQASAITGGADVTAANQKLCWYFDTGTNLPITPGAGSLTITWPSTAAKIYKVGA